MTNRCQPQLPDRIGTRDYTPSMDAVSHATAQRLVAFRWRCSSVMVLLVAMLSVVCGPRIQAAQRTNVASKAPGLQKLPAGWAVVKETEVQGTQLGQFSQKLGVPLTVVFNTVVQYENKNLQINTIASKSEVDAERLKETLRKGKPNPRWIVRNGANVYEFVVRSADDAHLASAARYALPIEPAKRSYEVAFDAVPIQSEDSDLAPDTRNRLFNLLLQAPAKPALTAEITSLSKGFKIAKEFSLLRDLQGQVHADWRSTSADVAASAENPELAKLSVIKVDTKLGMPKLDLSATISIDASRMRRINSKLDRSPLLASNSHFPTDLPELKQLVGTIIAPGDVESVKLRKLLLWFSDSKNIQYDGLTGSRYGTAVVCRQRFGRCWDYSDLFITMARIAGLPARQVYGWVYESEGHVWCDVIVDGNWQMVDPTTGTICGSDYLPFSVSADGELPIIYASKVTIRAK